MSADALRCNCRRKAETNLRCARCDTPLCPDCSVVGEVGMLCRGCGRGHKSHLYEVGGAHVARAAAVTLPLAAFGGWLLASVGFGGGLFLLWGILLYGLAVGEAAIRSSGRKRGLLIEAVAGAGAVLGLLAGFVLEAGVGGAAGGLGALASVALRSPWTYAALVGSTFIAVTRVRNL